jgi:hypothetical protein
VTNINPTMEKRDVIDVTREKTKTWKEERQSACQLPSITYQTSCIISNEQKIHLRLCELSVQLNLT